MQKNVIVIIGPTGAGKSHFIDILAGTKWANKKMTQSETDVRDKEVVIDQDQSQATTVLLVDAPGFDDATKADREIVRQVASWIQSKYGKQSYLLGVLYFLCIKDNRAVVRPQDSIHDLGEMCGLSSQEIGKRVVFVTTHWDVLTNREAGERRKQQLQGAVRKVGGQFTDFKGSKAEAEEIIRILLHSHPPFRVNIDTTRVKRLEPVKPPKVSKFKCSIQ